MKNLKTTLDFAKYYLEKGFNVIPLIAKSKVPFKDFPLGEYQNKIRTTAADVELWFGEKSSEFGKRGISSSPNIGIVTGTLSGVDVVDLDTEEAIKFWKDGCFSHGPTVKTTKGYHVYYRHRSGVGNFQKRDDLPGIDLRAQGGYVVAPPSIHPSGYQYQWMEDRSIANTPIVELPESILKKKTFSKPCKIDRIALDKPGILSVVDGEGIVLRKIGNHYQGMCPKGHDKETPSFTVYPDTESFCCYGACNVAGDAITFIRWLKGLDFLSALEYLGIEKKRKFMNSRRS